MGFDFSKQCLLKIMEHEFQKEGWPEEVKNYFNGDSYTFKEVLQEVREDSDLGRKVSGYYRGYLE